MKLARSTADSPRWSRIVAIWGAIAVWDATQTVLVMRSEGMHHNWLPLWLSSVLVWFPWAIVTPLVFRLGSAFPPQRLRPFTTWLVHPAACAVVGLSAAAWNSLVEVLLNPWAGQRPIFFTPLWIDKYYNGVLSSILLYSCILGAQYMLESSQRLAVQQAEAARLSELLSKAQLRALRQQIEPHFLFNTLNAIAGLVREERNDDAVNMIVGLSDFLRRVVEDSDRQQVALAEEIEFLQKYVDIQKARFADRLQVSVEIPRELLPAQFPALILQPMVENAIKHGIAKRVQGGVIRVTAFRSNGSLNLSVYNDGPGLPGRDEMRSGIGLSNVRSRLQGLYGDAFQLTMHDCPPSGVEVELSVPYREV
jgi:two-component system, LytTR family, sensor kinase